MYYKLLETAYLKYDEQVYLDFISYDDYNLNSINDIPNNLIQIDSIINYMNTNKLSKLNLYTYLQQNTPDDDPQILGYEIKI